MGWNCTACTYRNKNDGAKSCFQCQTPRAKKQSAEDAIIMTKSNDNDRKMAATSKKRGAEHPANSSSGTIESTMTAANKKAKTDTSSNAPQKKKLATMTNQVQSTLSFPVSTCSLVPSSYGPIPTEPYTTKATRSREVLKEVFKIEMLRNQQPKAVECALKGKSQIVVMATGGGKSLCYQLPAVTIGGTAIVISPLIALMKDQTVGLTKKGISAACVNSSNKESENTQILGRVLGRSLNSTTSKSKKSDQSRKPINLLYITPESLGTTRMQNILNELHKKKRLAFFAIDEAHCISSYGHDFRPAYRKLDYIRKQFPDLCVMALTATASPAVLADIKVNLNLEDAPCHVGSFDRPNIFYKCHYKDGLDALEERGSLKDLAKFVKKQHRRAKKEGRECSGIVYVHKKADTTMLAREIASRTELKVGAYHGGMKDAERTQVQEDWISGKLQIAVATVALGMGIDLAHVRYVVHWAIPKTMDGFYQESGRAGRDGLPAISLVYFSKDDANLFSFLINKEGENRKAKQGQAAAAQNTAATQRKLKQLECVVDYCTKPRCRRECVLKHFGEKETDPKTVCQKSCDFCQDPDKIERAIKSAESMRAMTKQKEMAKKKKSANAWDGQWSKPHGDGDDDDFFGGGRQEDWEVDGLGITGEAKTSKFAGGTNGFVSAGSLKKKLDSLEKMERRNSQRKNDNENDDFIDELRFKPCQSDRKERDPFPEHFKTQILASIKSTKPKPKPKEQSSTEIHASAEKLRAELAAIQAKKDALKARSSKAGAAASAPPPPVAFKQSSRRKA